jgi:FkbM family methyltransferase
MNLHTIDFNALYMQQKEQSTFKMKSKASWDKKASSMNSRVHASIYNEEFLNELNLKECETLLDVGCGVGNLSLKVALKLKTVYALDYSPQMLEYLKSNAKEQNIDNIITLEKSWYDSWEEIPSCDVVIASRSMEVKDMKEALEKINAKANKRVYITYKVGGSFVDKKILKAMGKAIFDKPDYIYVLNILYGMGINAKLDYLRSEGRREQYDSKESFIKSVEWSLDDLTQEDKEKLSLYYDSLGENKENVAEQYNYWALISWDVQN